MKASRRISMKKILMMVFSVVVLASLGSWAQTSSQKSDKNSTSTSGKRMTMAGTVSNDGKMFVSDKDSKSWKVDNPDSLKGHEGHHVSVNASEDPASDTLHVNSVKMLGKNKSTPSNSGGYNSGNKGGKY
jgi:membrane protein implicated in regulation of membrane protease activity